VRCSGSRYVIAVLRNTLDPLEFTLELYDSGTQRWTSRLLRVQEPQRDRVLPIPDSATELGFHRTTKTIALGPTTVGWVDLWRGILFCDVLDQSPVLRDMPLPKPARCNRATSAEEAPVAIGTSPSSSSQINRTLSSMSRWELVLTTM